MLPLKFFGLLSYIPVRLFFFLLLAALVLPLAPVLLVFLFDVPTSSPPSVPISGLATSDPNIMAKDW